MKMCKLDLHNEEEYKRMLSGLGDIGHIKPRIKIYNYPQRGFYKPPSKWLCESEYFAQVGESPEDAFRKWKDLVIHSLSDNWFKNIA